MAEPSDPLLSRAVLIGVGRYQKLSGLPAVHENLTTLNKVLCDDRVWGLPRGNCVVVDSPETTAEMLDPVVEAAHNATDTLLLYYAGHGLLNPHRGELHLSLAGSDPQRIYTSVPYDYFRDVLLESRAARRIVMLDCCYSGRALGQMANPVSAAVDEACAEGTYVLAAAAENKAALALPGARYTAFTGELLDIISSGISECGPFLDLDSIYRHLLAVMKSKGFPIPQKRDRNTAGQLSLIRNQAFANHLPYSAPLVDNRPYRAAGQDAAAIPGAAPRRPIHVQYSAPSTDGRPSRAAGQDTAAIRGGLALRRPQRLQYTAPSVDGRTLVETSRDLSAYENFGSVNADDFAHVGRNDPCPCGSRRKYKRCHGDPRMGPDLQP